MFFNKNLFTNADPTKETSDLKKQINELNSFTRKYLQNPGIWILLIVLIVISCIYIFSCSTNTDPTTTPI